MFLSTDGGKKEEMEEGGNRGGNTRANESPNCRPCLLQYSSSSSCAVVRIYRAKQTNSKNKWINIHCASAGEWERGCMCVLEHMSVLVCIRVFLFVCLCQCVGLSVNVCVHHRPLFMFPPSTAATGMNGWCVFVHLWS